jgi:hypothetical protein
MALIEIDGLPMNSMVIFHGQIFVEELEVFSRQSMVGWSQ